MQITKPGTYIATQRGYLFDRLHEEGSSVRISEAFIKANPKFSASWLELPEGAEDEAKPTQSRKKKVDELLELKAEYEEKFKEAPEATWTEAELKELLGK